MHTHVALTLPYVPVVAGCDSPCSDSIVQLSEEGKTVHALGSFLVDPRAAPPSFVRLSADVRRDTVGSTRTSIHVSRLQPSALPQRGKKKARK